MKNNNKNYKRGFTLMEVLVSTAIFAVVMAIATGVIAQGSSYSTKIKKMRETSEDARRLADMLTRDIKSVKSPIKAQYNSSINGNCIDDGELGSSAGTFNSGILILNDAYCSMYGDPGSALDSSSNQYDGSLIILAGSEKYMIYIYGSDKIFYSNTILIDTVLNSTMIDEIKNNTNNVISSSSINYKAIIGFGGYAPRIDSVISPETQKMQSIVNFVITVSVKDFIKGPYKGESATIRSSVTSRNYGI